MQFKTNVIRGWRDSRWIQHGVVMILLLFAAMLLSGKTASAATDLQMAQMKEKIIEAYQQYQTEVNINEFNIHHSADADAMTKLMTEILTQTPGLFYTGLSYQKIVNSQTDQVKKLVLVYDDAYLTKEGEINISKIEKTQKKIDDAVEKALLCVNSSMSKLEKALVLHDYLIQNTAYYNNASADSRLTEEGVFVKNKANCQGYSMAYAMLMHKVGIPVRFVASEKMGHIWNMIKIGGKWYHVDTTWDDPVEKNAREDQYGLVRHDYFLCSTKKMKTEKYYGFISPVTTGKKYDSAWWRTVSSAIYYRNGKWLFINDNGIVSRNSITSGKAKILQRLSGKAFYRLNSNKYYLITQNSVYLYDYSKNSLKSVWSTRKKYGNNYYLTQIKYQNSRIYYKVLKGSSHKKGSFRVKANGLAA